MILINHVVMIVELDQISMLHRLLELLSFFTRVLRHILFVVCIHLLLFKCLLLLLLLHLLQPVLLCDLLHALLAGDLWVGLHI